MTYFGFLLRFLLVPILVFFGITFWDHKRDKRIYSLGNGRAVWAGIGLHVILAVLYTTPWDNYLVATGVWYYNPKLVSGLLIGYVPIEEYTFFIVETILAGLWWWFLARRLPFTPNPDEQFLSNKKLVYLSTCLLISVWFLFTWLFFFGDAKWTYLSIIFFWALPPVIIQLLFGVDILWHYRKLLFWAIVVPGTYLSLTDIIALKETTWSISQSQSTGVLFFGILPLEEVIFFFITNVMIAFGLTLLLANVSHERFAEIRKQWRSWKEKRRVNLQAH